MIPLKETNKKYTI